MANDRPPSMLGDALSCAYFDALKTWQREHSKGRDPEVFLTSELAQVTITANLTPKRPGYVYLEVSGKRPWESSTYGYELLHKTARPPDPLYRRVV